MLKFTSIVRQDAAGSGSFGAKRGARTHEGVDFLASPGMLLLSPVSGVVTKLGYCYQEDLHYRYVEVTVAGERHRFFYTNPAVKKGQTVFVGDVLGIVQDIAFKYNKTGAPVMMNHVHYEIINAEGKKVSPII